MNWQMDSRRFCGFCLQEVPYTSVLAFRRKAAIALVRLMHEGESGPAAQEDTADGNKYDEALGGEQLKEESGRAGTGGAGVNGTGGAGESGKAERRDAVEHEAKAEEKATKGGGGLGTR